MMKKIIISLMVLLLVGCVAAQQSGPRNMTNQTGNATPVLISAGEQIMTMSQIRDRIQQRSEELNNSLENVSERLRHIYTKENRVRLAVHALLAIENRTGGIGRNISAIAREFNNSVRNMTMAQEQIENRSRFARFFVGYNKNAVDKIDAALQQNQLRLEQLEQLRERCNCTNEVRAYMQEQIQEMQQEQERLGNLSASEKTSKGIFGWLWK